MFDMNYQEFQEIIQLIKSNYTETRRVRDGIRFARGMCNVTIIPVSNDGITISMVEVKEIENTERYINTYNIIEQERIRRKRFIAFRNPTKEQILSFVNENYLQSSMTKVVIS